MKKRRQAKILELIANNDIETQEELQDYLTKYGFEVTQATISRDIKELRLVKDLSSKGRYVYSTGKKRKNNVNYRAGGIFSESNRCYNNNNRVSAFFNRYTCIVL